MSEAAGRRAAGRHRGWRTRISTCGRGCLPCLKRRVSSAAGRNAGVSLPSCSRCREVADRATGVGARRGQSAGVSLCRRCRGSLLRWRGKGITCCVGEASPHSHSSGSAHGVASSSPQRTPAGLVARMRMTRGVAREDDAGAHTVVLCIYYDRLSCSPHSSVHCAVSNSAMPLAPMAVSLLLVFRITRHSQALCTSGTRRS